MAWIWYTELKISRYAFLDKQTPYFEGYFIVLEKYIALLLDST